MTRQANFSVETFWATSNRIKDICVSKNTLDLLFFAETIIKSKQSVKQFCARLEKIKSHHFGQNYVYQQFCGKHGGSLVVNCGRRWRRIEKTDCQSIHEDSLTNIFLIRRCIHLTQEVAQVLPQAYCSTLSNVI